MKNYKKISFFLFLSIFILSCDSDHEEEQFINQPNNTRVLVSKTENFLYTDGYSKTTNFSSGKIIDIVDSEGKQDLYSYLNDNVSQIIEKNAEGAIMFTKTFSYDSSDRLIERREIPNPDVMIGWDNYVVHQFLYANNSISIVSKFFDFNDVLQDGEGLMLLDLEENNIIRSHVAILGMAQRDELAYAGNNPMIATHFTSNNPAVVTNFEYSNNVAADAYNIAKSMFGTEWRTNFILSTTGNGQSALSGPSIVPLLSENYLNGASSESNSNGNISTKELSVVYEFDENNLLIGQKETVIQSQNAEPLITVITYQYE